MTRSFDHGSEKRHFALPSLFNGLTPSKMAAYPYAMHRAPETTCFSTLL
jgi:hypothetical protein